MAKKKKKASDQEIIMKLAETIFKDEYGEALNLYPTQRQIFYAAAKTPHKYTGMIAPSQYGKSLGISLGALVRVVALPLKLKIVAPSKAKSRIIMDYIIGHIFDHPLLVSQLQYEGKLDYLHQERNKDHLSFRRGGEIKILTADARNKRAVGQAVLGEGGDIVILDESSLIDDDLYAMIFRMIGGRKDACLIELGNAIRRNHFYRSMTSDPDYHKIWIDYKVALTEGRFDEDYIEKARKLKFFDRLYECKFPDETAEDEKGYQDLLTYDAIDRAMTAGRLPASDEVRDQLKLIRYKFNSKGQVKIESKEELKARGIDSPDIADACSLTFAISIAAVARCLGVDVGAGGCESIYALRAEGKISLVSRDNIKDMMAIAGKIKKMAEDLKVPAGQVGIDTIGIGKGVCDRLIEQGFNCVPVNNAEAAVDVAYKFTPQGQKVKHTDFSNKRAEIYWRLKEFVEGEIGPKADRAMVRWI